MADVGSDVMADEDDEYLEAWMELSALWTTHLEEMRTDLLGFMDRTHYIPEHTLRAKVKTEAQDLLHEAWHRLFPEEPYDE